MPAEIADRGTSRPSGDIRHHAPARAPSGLGDRQHSARPRRVLISPPCTRSRAEGSPAVRAGSVSPVTSSLAEGAVVDVTSSQLPGSCCRDGMKPLLARSHRVVSIQLPQLLHRQGSVLALRVTSTLSTRKPSMSATSRESGPYSMRSPALGTRPSTVMTNPATVW